MNKNRSAILLMVVFFLGLGTTAQPAAEYYRLQTLAEGLENPWGIAVISNREVLITERVGRLRRVVDGALQPLVVSGVP